LGVRAIAGNGSVTLSWQVPASDNGSAITGYEIYRGTTSGAETFLASPGNVTAYVDSNVTGGQAYYYQIRAVNVAGEGLRSLATSVMAVAVPGPPLGLNATATTGHITLTWQVLVSDNGSPITGYEIYRGTAPGAETFIATTGNVTSYLDSNVTGGQTYYYQVRAVNGAGEGPRSTEVHVVAMSNSGSGSRSGAVSQAFLIIVICGIVAGVAIVSVFVLKKYTNVRLFSRRGALVPQGGQSDHAPFR
jgi:predicted phage tail protein